MILHKKYSFVGLLSLFLMGSSCFIHGNDPITEKVKLLDHAQERVDRALTRKFYSDYKPNVTYAKEVLDKLSQEERKTIKGADVIYDLYNNGSIKEPEATIQDTVATIQEYKAALLQQKLEEARLKYSKSNDDIENNEPSAYDEYLKRSAEQSLYSDIKYFFMLRWLFQDKEYTPFGSTDISQATMLRAGVGAAIITAAAGASYYAYKKWFKKKNEKFSEAKAITT